ncbi:O-antigen ligase family protein [Robertmurraya sp. GLU-23]
MKTKAGMVKIVEKLTMRIKDKEEKYLVNLISIILIATPFIDLLNGLLAGFSFSPGQLIRPIFMFISLVVIYLYSKKYLYYLGLLIGTMSLTTIIDFILFGDSVIDQMIWNLRILNTLVLTVLFIVALPRLTDTFVNKSIKYIEVVVGFISFVILFSALTNSGFNTYGGQGVGFKGFFLGQNDITAVISMCFPIALYSLIHNRDHRIPRSANVLVTLFASILLGTKSGMIFILGSFIAVLFITKDQLKLKEIFLKNAIKILVSAIAVISSFLWFFWETLVSWVNYQLHFLFSSSNFITFLLSGRNKAVQPMFEVLADNPIYIFIGSTFNKGQKLISEKVGYDAFVEFDPLSIFFYNGIFVFILYMAIYISICNISLNDIRNSVGEKQIILIAFIIGAVYSTFGGHVLPSGIAGTYFSYFAGLVFYHFKHSAKKA